MQGLEERKREVLVGRFGLNGNKPETLQAIGDKFKVTRERVRQIESIALAEVRDLIEENAEAVLVKISSYLTGQGGIASEENLMTAMQKELGKEATLANLSFLREVSGRFGYQPETDEFKAFWHNNGEAAGAVKKLIDRTVTLMSPKRDAILSGKESFQSVFAQTVKAQGLEKGIGDNYLLISKKFAINPYGDFGLSEWPEVKPATIRDWAYLVLKKANRPMHFREIAQGIAEVHTKKRKVFTPTVHNELIKDKRFVLVGRGTYSLTECGYQKGGIKNLIKEMLTKKGPMKTEEVVSLVSAQRLFKRNTIILHLMDKKVFKKGEDGRYGVTEA